jgi:hypothetical protein
MVGHREVKFQFARYPTNRQTENASNSFRLALKGTPHASVRIPMFSNLAVLHTKHVEPKCLVVLVVTSGPCWSHVDDNHFVLADHIQHCRL